MKGSYKKRDCVKHSHTHTHPPLLGVEENQYVFEWGSEGLSAQGELTDLLSFALLSPCLLLTPPDTHLYTHTHTHQYRWSFTQTYRRNTHTQTQRGRKHMHQCNAFPKGQNSKHFCHRDVILDVLHRNLYFCAIHVCVSGGQVLTAKWKSPTLWASVK